MASGEESRLTQFGFEPSDEAVQPRALGGAKNNKGNLTFLEVSRQNQKKLKQEAKQSRESDQPINPPRQSTSSASFEPQPRCRRPSSVDYEYRYQ